MTFMLLTVLLTLLHTNHKIENIQLKAEFTPSDCYVDELSQEQIDLLQKDPDIQWTALQQGSYDLYKCKEQNVFLTRNDDTAMTMMAKLTEGRLPQKSGEIVAERWVLLNLGIEPVINQEICITEEETGEEKSFILTGILSDIYGNKKYGTLNLYTVMDESSTEPYLVYIRFQDSVDYESKAEELRHRQKSDQRMSGKRKSAGVISDGRRDDQRTFTDLYGCFLRRLPHHRIVENTAIWNIESHWHEKRTALQNAAAGTV